MLPLALMAASCSDENKEAIAEDLASNSGLKSTYLSSPHQHWKVGGTIKYYLMSATAEDRQFVRECMDEWQAYANIRFEEIKRQNSSDLRIAFNHDIRQREQPLNYGGKTKQCNCLLIGPEKGRFTNMPDFTVFRKDHDTPSELKAQILHELGHVLGLEDEFLNPKKPYSFNYNEMRKDWLKQNIPANDIEGDIKDRWMYAIWTYNVGSFSDLGYNSFDPESIMMQDISPNWISTGVRYRRGTTLSANDIAIIKKLYPYPFGVVPLYLGSEGNSDGVIARYQDFSSKSKIRALVGYGYDYDAMETKVGHTYTMPKESTNLYTFVNLKTREIRCSKIKYQNSQWYYEGIGCYAGQTGNWIKAGSLWMFDKEGDGKAVIIKYNNQKTGRVAYSTPNDTYLINKGYTPSNGVYFSLLKEPEDLIKIN